MLNKTQAIHPSVKYARIVKHGRGEGARFGVVHDLFWREEEPWIVLKLPTGVRMAVPAALTDLPAEAFSTTEGHSEIHAAMLLELARFCQDLRVRSRRRATKKISRRQA